MGLNRQPFSRTLREMCSHVGLDVTPEEVWLLVRSRNSLVHCGRFYCETATPEDGRRCPPMGRAWGEYCFLIDFFERFFLRLCICFFRLTLEALVMGHLLFWECLIGSMKSSKRLKRMAFLVNYRTSPIFTLRWAPERRTPFSPR